MVSFSALAYTLGGLAFGATAVLLLIRRRNSKKWVDLEKIPGLCLANTSQSLKDQVIIVTGANTGLGLQAARELAKRLGSGSVLILACRNVVAGNEAARNIQDECVALGHAKPDVRCMLLDLASLESVRSFVDEVKHHHDSVQTLVCNAGVWIPDDKKSKSVDGFEVHAGVNHLGHFLLANLLRDHGNPRVVVVSSGLARFGQVTSENVDELIHSGRPASMARKGPGFAPTGYCDSKMMNVMFAKELAKRFPDTQAYSVCPGMCKTELGRHVNFPIYKKLLFIPMLVAFVRTGHQGAQNLLYAALQDSEKLVNGGMYRDGELVVPTDEKVNEMVEECRKLWEVSSKLVSLE